MSYDLRIQSDDSTVQKSRVQPLVERFQTTLDAHGYPVSIDLEFDDGSGETRRGERINLVSIHVPYGVMDKTTTDHSIFYEGASAIAEELGWRVFDPQHDIHLDHPEFELKRRRQIATNLRLATDALVRRGDILEVWTRRGESVFAIDLATGRRVECSGPAPAREHDNSAEHESRRATYESKEIVVTENGDEICRFQRCGKVSKLEFADNGESLVSNAYRNKTLKLWSVAEHGLIRNFSGYSTHVSDFMVLDGFVVTTGDAGLTLFDRSSGDILAVIRPLNDSVVAFTPEGNWQGELDPEAAIELDWIDNAKCQSRVFIPALGYALISRQSFQLEKLERTSGTHRPELLQKIVASRV